MDTAARTRRSVDMRRYLRVLKAAYVLEVLGEAVYREGASGWRSRADSKEWSGFADTEARMSLLIETELRRLGSAPPARLGSLAARGAGALAQLLNAPLSASLIRLVLGRRRYALWAMEFRGLNGPLWDALLDHERRQIVYFEEACLPSV